MYVKSDFSPVFLLFVLLIHGFQADKVPTQGEIEDYKDPIIGEIFSSINSPATPSSGNGGPTQGGSAPPPPESTNTNVGGVNPDPNGRQVPTNNGHGPNPAPNGSPYPREKPGATQLPVEQPNFSSAASNGNGNAQQNAFGELAIQGAQNFYTGVQQAGRILGIDSGQYQQYEVPLISSAASLFGRRK